MQCPITGTSQFQISGNTMRGDPQNLLQFHLGDARQDALELLEFFNVAFKPLLEDIPKAHVHVSFLPWNSLPGRLRPICYILPELQVNVTSLTRSLYLLSANNISTIPPHFC